MARCRSAAASPEGGMRPEERTLAIDPALACTPAWVVSWPWQLPQVPGKNDAPKLVHVSDPVQVDVVLPVVEEEPVGSYPPHDAASSTATSNIHFIARSLPAPQRRSCVREGRRPISRPE